MARAQASPYQELVDRYRTSLTVPSELLELHSRSHGHPTRGEMALAPAAVLTSIAAFEGFAEEVVAVSAREVGWTWAQIAKAVAANSIELGDLEKNLQRMFPHTFGKAWSAGWELKIMEPTATRWRVAKLTWTETLNEAEGWMQVRHLLAHGVARGYLPEVWGGSMRPGGRTASSVLKPQVNDPRMHSLTLQGAITCARVYRYGAEALCDLAAALVGAAKPKWNDFPPFDYKVKVGAATAVAVTLRAESLVEHAELIEAMRWEPEVDLDEVEK